MLAARHRDETEGAMRRFLAKHVAATTGTLSCFDRLLFKGHLPLGYPHAMEAFLSHRGILVKDLKGFVLKQAERLKVHAHAVAEKAGRPYEYFESPVRKDQRGRKPGRAYGARAWRPAPDHIDEVIEVLPPAPCACGGAVDAERVAVQCQSDLPPVRPHVTAFRIHVGRCRRCGRRVQGRDARQTSTATGAAASQVGPRALA
jgi:hypothetical protein